MTEEIVRWAVPGIGILAIVFALVQAMRTRAGGAGTSPGRGFLIWPNVLSAVLIVLATVGVWTCGMTRFPDLVPGILIGLGVGWALAFLLFLATGLVSRKLTSGGGADPVRTAHSLLTASGMLSCAAALLGVGLMAAFGVRSLEALLALGLGFWLGSTFWSLPSALYGGRHVQESKDAPPHVLSFRGFTGEMAFLVTATLVVAAALAGFRFPEGNTFGAIYPLGAFATSLLFALLVSPMLGRNPGGRSALRVLGVCVFVAGSAVGAYFLASSVLADLRAFYCFATGLATALLLMLISRLRPPLPDTPSPFGAELAVAGVLMILASAVLGFRWMGGYGVAVTGVGLLASFPVMLPLGAVWAANRLEKEIMEAGTPPMVNAVSRFAEVLTAGGALLAVIAAARLFSEGAEVSAKGINIVEPYPLIGLVIGAIFPILLRTCAGSDGARSSSGSLTVLGRRVAFRSLGIWLVAGIVPLLTALVWRAEAAGAFVVGLAASEVFLMLTLWLDDARHGWLGEGRGPLDDATRLATRATHVVVVGSALVTALIVPSLIEFTGTLTRGMKIRGMAVVLVVVFVWVLVHVWRRMRMEGRHA